MVRLELSEEERAVLVDILESFLSDLRLEIADTERKAVRDPLKAQEGIIKNILEMLRQSP
jgi:hypothetical protein